MSIGTVDANDKKRKSKRNRIILASLIALALLSLFVFLGNPGLWTPDQNDEPEAEATHDDGNVTDSNNSSQDLVDNSTGDNSVITLDNNTATGGSGNYDSGAGSNSGSGSGYVITYGGSSSNSSGPTGGGGGGGGHQSDDNGGSSNTNNAPIANDQSVSTTEDTPLSIQMSGSDSDGNAITYSLTSNPAHGSLSSFNSSNGSVLYTPAENYNGADSFTFSVSDTHGASDSALVSIIIISVEDAPLASNSTSAVTDEDKPVNIDLNLSVSDPDGFESVISIVNMTEPENGSVILHANNTVTYTSDPDFNGIDVFAFQATDGEFVSNFANVTVTVNPINDVPRAQNFTVVTPEDTPVDIVLIDDISDVDGDVFGLLVSQLPANGVITISPDNSTVTYAPNPNFEGADNFVYVISDGTSNSTAFVDITVTAVNDAPTIIDGALGSVTVDEDVSTIIDIISNVFDPDGDSVTITNVTDPAHGSATLNPNGTVTYTPDPNFNGEDSFDFTVDDGNGGTATGTVTVTVIPINDVPVSSDMQVSGDEDSTFSFQLNSTDADSDALVFTLVSLPSHGTATMTDSSLGMVEYTPDTNYNGDDSLSFQATDGTADSAIATVSITVNSVNDDPVANDDTFAGTEDTPMELNVLANDLDIEGDDLSVAEINDAPSHGSADINLDNTITYTPDLDFNGTDSFEYKISDGNGGTDAATVTVSIGAINDAPVAEGGIAFGQEDATSDIMLNSTDSDGDTIQYSIISMPSHGALEIIVPDGSVVRYTPSANYNGPDEVTFQTTDGIEDSNIASVSIDVEPANDTPIANTDNFSGPEDSNIVGNVLANDVDIDGDGLVAVNATSTAHGTLTLNADGTFSYIPEADFVGSDSFQYMITDGNGGFASALVMITVDQVNDAPTANDDFAYTTLSQPVFVKVLENDSDIDSLSLNVGSKGTSSHGTVTISSDGKAVIYTPNNGYSGNDQFTYTVTDGSLSDTGTVTIKVYNIRFGHIQPPVGGGGDHEFEQGNTASVRLQLKDASGNDVVNALVLLQVQQLDENNLPVGPVSNATSAGGSNEGNVFDYTTSWYQYNLKTDDMAVGKWALYVYMIDTSTDPLTWVLLEDQPIDGISTTIIIK